MRIAALYDVHGNLPALEATLDEVGRCGVDAIVVGGDVVPGPMPDESLDLLLATDLPLHCLRGNGERAVLDVLAGREPDGVPESARPVIEWTAAQLSVEHERWIGTWPSTVRIAAGGVGEVLFCHATPRFMHTRFDLDAAAQRVRATRYPMAEHFASHNVLDVPSEAEMLERLGRVQM